MQQIPTLFQDHHAFKFMMVSGLLLSTGMAIPAFGEAFENYCHDAAITAKIKQAILADPKLKVMAGQVDTTHGTVQLSGTVTSEAEKTETVKVASQVEGVERVTDNLSVKDLNVH